MAQKAKLSAAIQALDPSEREEFRHFLLNPAWHASAETLALWDYLQSEDHNWSATGRETFATTLNNGGGHRDVDLRLLGSELLRLLERYLIWRQIQRNATLQRSILTEAYMEAGLSKHAGQVIRQTRKSLDQSTLQNADYYQADLDLYFKEVSFQQQNKRSDPTELQEYFDRTNLAFITQLLRQSCQLLTNSGVFNTQFNYGILPDLLQYVKNKDFLEVPVIELYYNFYQLITTQSQVYYNRLVDQLPRHIEAFSPAEIKDLYLAVNNYGIRKVNQGDKSFERIALNWYKVGLDIGVLIDKRRMSMITFNNIAALALKSKEVEWTKRFVDEYCEYLPAGERDNVVQFNLARIHYLEKTYAKATECLQKTHFKDSLLNLASKALLAKVYFESGEWNLLEYHLLATKAFAYRQKRLGYHKRSFLNFIRGVDALVTRNPDRQKIEKLLQSLSPTVEKDWLLEMAARA
ncbi:MAG: hypothetical protein KDC28_14245 [Saprospiraceae bacterium]|nr:hypothetical protein [Saprospiraceae bacterium]